MKTPIDFKNKLKEGKVTEAMLSECAYSVNKRAKNCRDQERYYREESRHWRCGDRYGNEEKYCKQKEIYYEMKEKLLKLATPICIHRETVSTSYRVYEGDSDWEEALKNRKILNRGSYYEKLDEDESDYYDPNDPKLEFDYRGHAKRLVEFVDVEGDPAYHYYLFYDLAGKHSFHTPIKNPGSYDLPIVDIGSLDTYGCDTNDLISVGFVKKVIALIDSGEYTFLAS